MTHEYELKIMDFMRTVSKTSSSVDDMLLKPATKDIEHFIRKLYEDDPNRPFSLRMSSIGRPLCQLQMEKAKAGKVEDDWNFPLRMMYGGVIEGLTVSVLRHSGIRIDEEQTHVKLSLGFVDIPGTLDIVLDGRVWDIKSASPYSFANKFQSYESLTESDDFGYVPQLYGYSKARDLPPGGWIVVDKSSGVIKVLPVPNSYEQDMAKSLQLIENNARVLLDETSEFRRQFEDKPETFKKRLTGSRVLESPCIFCKFRYSCWPTLQHLPSASSTAYDKPYKYYTHCA